MLGDGRTVNILGCVLIVANVMSDTGPRKWQIAIDVATGRLPPLISSNWHAEGRIKIELQIAQNGNRLRNLPDDNVMIMECCY